MKLIKRTLLSILILSTIVFIFRGWLYRHLVTYKSVGLRSDYLVSNKILIEYIEASIDNQTLPNIKQIVNLGLSITSNKLNYTINKNDIDPNKLINSESAHCVGYATFFSSTCNYLIDKYNLAETWKAKVQVGHLYFLGTSIHKYFNSSFCKDHDFVTIENKTTGEIFAVDPTINDYLNIDYITYSK